VFSCRMELNGGKDWPLSRAKAAYTKDIKNRSTVGGKKPSKWVADAFKTNLGLNQKKPSKGEHIGVGGARRPRGKFNGIGLWGLTGGGGVSTELGGKKTRVGENGRIGGEVSGNVKGKGSKRWASVFCRKKKGERNYRKGQGKLFCGGGQDRWNQRQKESDICLG